MGSRMAANLAPRRPRADGLQPHPRASGGVGEEHGGTVAATPAEVGAAAEVVITMVVDGPQVEAMLLGDDGVADGAAAGTLCVDMSTIAPAETRAIGAALAERDVGFVDAPVTGSSPKAEDGTLTIMAGGSAERLRARRAAVRGDGRARRCTSASSARARRSSSSTTPSRRRTRARSRRR